MFNTYVVDRAESPRLKWLVGSLIFALIVTALVLFGLVVWSWWKIEKIVPKYVSVSFMSASLPPPAPPPPPPPPPPKKKKTDTVKTEIKPKVIAEVVQPKPVEEQKPPESETEDDAGEDEGVEGGVEGGVVGGVVGGQVGGVEGGILGGTGTAPPPPPPPPEPPKIVPITAIQGSRIAGVADIRPLKEVAILAVKQGTPRFMFMAKLCLSAGGEPTRIDVIKGTGFPAQDAHIKSEMQKWRYRPYTVNGKSVAVCTAVTFNYVIE